MKFRPRNTVHIVTAAVLDSAVLPVPYAEPGTVMSLTRVMAEWNRYPPEPWRLRLVTVYGAANNGSPVTVDYFPDNPMKQPPRELSEWIASTHPGHVNEEQSA